MSNARQLSDLSPVAPALLTFGQQGVDVATLDGKVTALDGEVDSLTGVVDTKLSRTDFAIPAGKPLYAARAWVNFNGTGSVSIRASSNVTGVSDLGTGWWRVGLDHALQDANGAVLCTLGRYYTGGTNPVQGPAAWLTGVSTIDIYAGSDNSTLSDSQDVQLAVFR